MKINKYPPSLIEVWEWKDKVYKKLSNIPDKIKFIEKDTCLLIKKLGLKRVSAL